MISNLSDQQNLVTTTIGLQQLEIDIDTNTPEYKAALDKLRFLRDPCLKLIDVLKLQGNASWQKAVERIYEIMEEKRYSRGSRD